MYLVPTDSPHTTVYNWHHRYKLSLDIVGYNYHSSYHSNNISRWNTTSNCLNNFNITLWVWQLTTFQWETVPHSNEKLLHSWEVVLHSIGKLLHSLKVVVQPRMLHHICSIYKTFDLRCESVTYIYVFGKTL